MSNIIENDCRKIIQTFDFEKLRNKRILITGASGFLGWYILNALALANRELELNCSIQATGLSRPRPNLAQLLKRDKKISYRKIDLTKSFRLAGYDYIFHAAGYGQPARFINDPLSVVKINTEAVARLIEASPKATFVFFSSAEIYGEIPPKLLPVKEEYYGNSPLHNPRSVYAEAKRLGEALVATYHRKFQTPFKIVRISHVYGPGLPATDTRVMSEFIAKALKTKKIELLDEGKAIKTYGYIADVVTMILFAAIHGQEMVYNVGGKDSLSILELAQKISKHFANQVEVTTTRSKLAHIGKDPGIVKLNLTRITSEMKNFKFTPFAQGLAKTIAWTE